MIRQTDEFLKKSGTSRAQHYKLACRILWPHIDWHRWMELCNNEIRRPGAKCTTLLGAGSTGKTATAAWEYLLEYYASPNDTLVLISSTDIRGLELRVWGNIKSLHEMAKEKFDWIPGHLIDSKHAIATDDIEDDDVVVRDLRKGVIGIPTVAGGRQVGLSKWIGIKQKKLRLVADEAQSMVGNFLSAFSNLNNNVDFQAVILGNPNDVLDQLGIAAEPTDGWAGHLEPDKTSTWDTQFFNGRCVNLVGTDSPNFDFPNDQPPRYPYLVSYKKIQETLSAFKKDSFEYYSQCVGVMKISQLARRVITRDLCRQFHVTDTAVWLGEARIKVAALDSSYGGDRCVGGHAEFGKCADGKTRIQFYPHHIVPVIVKSDRPMAAEDIISDYEKSYCESNQVPPAHFYHDSTGRGSLGTSLARIWSSACNPVEFGGSPTKRPVTIDTFVVDKLTGQKRLKTCDEAYSKFVTELWWSLRLAIESDQVRGLGQEVIDELCMREWDRVSNDRIEVESKIEMKERTRKSPDLGDWAVIILEGARRLGFEIERLGSDSKEDSDENYFAKEADEWQSAIKAGLLKY